MYDRVQNCIKCGYELNRIALLLHLFSLFHGYSFWSVIGVGLVVLSYAFTYFGESIRIAKDSDTEAHTFTLLLVACTALSYAIWFIQQIVRGI